MELKTFLLGHEFTQCHRDQSFFIKYTAGKCCIILVYVDNLLVNRDDETTILAMKVHIHKAFTIKDLGKLRYFLGIEIGRGVKGTLINQRKYCLDIIKDVGMEHCSPVGFPFLKGNKIMQR